jgi:hypothetical protein
MAYPVPVNFDNASKLLSFGEPHDWIGAVTYGDAVIGTTLASLRTAQSFVPEFEASLPKKRLTVEGFAIELGKFFMARWSSSNMPSPASGMTFVVGGYDADKAYGSVYALNIPNQQVPAEQSVADFGITYGGQAEHAIRLMQGCDPRVFDEAKKIFAGTDQQVNALRAAVAPMALAVPFPILPLQDCIDLATFLIRTTVAAQKLSVGIRGVGGVIDVAVITRRESLRFVQRKKLIGEANTAYQPGRTYADGNN